MEEENNHIEEDLNEIDGPVEEGDYLEENEGDIQVVLTENDGQNVDLDEEMDDANSVNQENEEQLTQDDSIQRFLGHSDSVYSVALSPVADFSNPATTIAASGGGDDKAFLWNASTGDKLFELSGHTDSVNSVAFNYDGKMVATGSLDGIVKVWDTQTGILVANLEGPQKEIEFVTWHSKGNFLVAGSADGTAWMWLPVKPETVIVFAGHSGSVTCGSFSQDGKTLVTGSEDGKVKIWDPKTGQTIRTIEGHNFHQGPIYCLQTTSNGLVISGSEDGTAKIANLSTGKVLGSLGGHDASVETVGISSVLPLAATGATDNKLNIYDLNSLQLRVTCAHEDSVTRLIWHPTQPLIYTASVDKCLRMWDARNGQCVKTWKGHNNAILDLAISRDGNYIVSGSDDQASLVFKM